MSTTPPGAIQDPYHHLYEFGYDHDRRMKTSEMRGFLRSKGLPFSMDMKKYQLLVLIEEHVTVYQHGGGPNRRDEKSFDPATYDTAAKRRQFLTYHDIPYLPDSKGDHLVQLVRNNASLLRAQKLNTTQTRPLSTVHENQPQGVRTTEPEGNLHPVSRSDPQTSPTVRVELAVPAVQAPVAGPEAFLANLWHQVRERNWYLLLLAILPLLFKLLQYKNGP